MNFEKFLIKLNEAYNQGLPGIHAQQLLAPANRPHLEEYISSPSFNPRLSAVTLVLVPGINNLPYVYLIKRNEYEGTHSGQIAFPGGKFDESTDLHLLDTASRELFEELGIERTSLNVLGPLTDIYIPVSNFLVKPFLCSLSFRPQLILNSREVKEVLELPLQFLLQEDLQIIRNKPLFSGNQKLKNVPQFDYDGKIIWGATAMILNEFRMLLKQNSIAL